MNCRQAKSDIALWIGEDLTDVGAREELRRHVAACPPCRAHYRRLKNTFRVLEHADREATYDSSDSVWPELSRRLDRRSRRPMQGNRFNGWLPFAAMTVACMLLVAVMANPVPQTAPRSSPPSVEVHRKLVPFPRQRDSFEHLLHYESPQRADASTVRTVSAPDNL